MNPLNPFPDLLSYALASPVMIRLALGGFYIIWTSNNLGVLWKKGTKNINLLPWWAPLGKNRPSATEAVPSAGRSLTGWTSRLALLIAFFAGISVFIGWYTQIGALVLALFSVLFAYNEKKTRIQFLLLAVMALSLLVSGAGFWAFDLPL